jgi:Outer membrane protein beta-barrel domain
MKLKIALMALALMVLGTMKASAQSFDFGLESGMNFSNFVGSDANSLNGSNALSSRLGFVGGGFLSLNFGPSFSIRPEALYEQKGAQVTGTTTTYEADYFEIPVLLKFGLGLPGLNPCLLVGPSFNWSTVSSLPNGSGNLNSGDVGLVGGLDFDFGKFDISGRYELGLDNVSAGKNVQNGTFTILMGYAFI